MQQEHLIHSRIFQIFQLSLFSGRSFNDDRKCQRDARRWFRWRTASESSHMSRGFRMSSNSFREAHFFLPPYFLLQPPKHNILGCGWWNEVPDIVLPVAETVLSCVFDEASCPRLVNTGEGAQMNQKRSQKVFDDRWTEVKINVIFYVLLCCQRENVKGNIFKGTKISWLFKCF